jgi:hypothetical protein
MSKFYKEKFLKRNEIGVVRCAMVVQVNGLLQRD